MSTTPDFDAVHVISDLHLGGERDHEIFTEEQRLAEWIDTVWNSETKRVALVLAGDIIDFISVYRDQTYFSPSDAMRQIDLIFGFNGANAEASSIKPLPRLGAALRGFVERPKEGCVRTLVVLIGNHDVELAIPRVRERLRRNICGESAEKRARLIFAVDGQGWQCTVRRHKVYCVHGNEADPVNRNDHEGMRRVAAALERDEQGLSSEAAIVNRYWTRNFGTSLVVDVLNKARKTIPYIDLLKPEEEPLADIVQALMPGEIGDRAMDLLRLAPRGAKNEVFRGTLGGASEGDGDELAKRPSKPRRDELSPPRTPPLSPLDVERLEALVREGRAPEDLAEGGTLGPWDLVDIKLRQIVGASTTRPLWRSLTHWESLRGYREVEQGDRIYAAYDPHLGPDVKVFIAGHTHLPRAYRGGKRLYFNSGTWIDLLRIDHIVPPHLDDEEHVKNFEHALEDLKSGERERLKPFLDTAHIGTAVSVYADDEGGATTVKATLHRVTASKVIGEDLKTHLVGGAQ